MFAKLSYPDRSKILNYFLLTVILLFLAGGYQLFSFEKRIREAQPLSLTSAQAPSLAVSSLPSHPLTGGNLQLDPLVIEIPLIDLQQELEVELFDYRPDSKEDRSIMSFSLKKSGQKKVCHNQEKVYLLSSSSSLIFSYEPTSFWFVPTLLPSKKVLIKVGAHLPEKTIPAKDLPKKILSFALLPKEGLIRSSDAASFPIYMKQLSAGKWWGRDLLYQVEKKWEYLEMAQENPYFCHVLSESFLIFKDGKWKVGDLSEASGLALAHVKSIQPKLMEIEGWDPEGKEKFAFAISLQPSQPLRTNCDDLLSSIHLRTKKQISCFCGKQRILLRVGEQMMMKEGKWRRYLSGFSHAPSEGELLCFEKIVDEGKEKSLFFSLYNPTHTLKKSFTRPLRRQSLLAPPSMTALPKKENSPKAKVKGKP